MPQGGKEEALDRHTRGERPPEAPERGAQHQDQGSAGPREPSEADIQGEEARYRVVKFGFPALSQ